MKEKELLALKRTLAAEIAERQKYLDAVDTLLDRLHQQNGTGTLPGETVLGTSADGAGRADKILAI